jgi:hypothetical protein
VPRTRQKKPEKSRVVRYPEKTGFFPDFSKQIFVVKPGWPDEILKNQQNLTN